MLQLSGEKMSKSLGNLVTIEDFLAAHDGDVLRLLVLNASYRSPLSYSDEIVGQAERGLERLRSALKPAPAGSIGAAAAQLELLHNQMEKTELGFTESMDDDFNSAGALGHLFELVRAINQARAAGAAADELEPAQTQLRTLTGVLGLRLGPPDGQRNEAADAFVDLLVDVRTELRKQKLWGMSDLVRDRLAALDVILEDLKEGTTWRWKR